jgi:hypothetical protein
VTEYVAGVFELSMHEAVMVAFGPRLVGAAGHINVSPVEVEPESEIGPAKSLMLVSETDRIPLLPELMSVGMMLMEKSPT